MAVNSRRIWTIVGVLGVLVALISGYRWAADKMNPFNDAAFDQQRWLAQYNTRNPRNPRGPMVDDLRQHVLRTGMTRQQVEALLGKPDAGGHDGTDAPSSPKDGSRYSYALGHWRCLLCESTLDIAFSTEGKVVSTKVVGH